MCKAKACFAIGIAHHECVVLCGLAVACSVACFERYVVNARYGWFEAYVETFALHGCLRAYQGPLTFCGIVERVVREFHCFALHHYGRVYIECCFRSYGSYKDGLCAALAVSLCIGHGECYIVCATMCIAYCHASVG